jgi:hypothetical protein
VFLSQNLSDGHEVFHCIPKKSLESVEAVHWGLKGDQPEEQLRSVPFF